MTAMEPRDDGFVVVVLHYGIAIDRMRCAFADSLLNGWRNGKVHISYPHGDDRSIIAP
jgi:hypothetical protein